MKDQEREPTRDELLAMAYVDGELEAEARTEFETRMAGDSALLREVAELRKLAVIARQTAPPEPMDFEWERLRKGLVQPGGHFLGFLLLAVGALGLSGWGVWEMWRSEEEGPIVKVLVSTLLLGFAILFLVVLRGRLRTMPYDPYTEVQR